LCGIGLEPMLDPTLLQVIDTNFSVTGNPHKIIYIYFYH